MPWPKRILISCSGLWLLLCSAVVWAQPDFFQGRVEEIIDGDNIRVKYSGGRIRIQLYGIHCPDLRQAYGEQARKMTTSLAWGQYVSVKVKARPRECCWLAEVVLSNGSNLSQVLLKAGLAWWSRQYAPRDTVLKDLETEARKTKRGLWADQDPVPPWEWRLKNL